MTKIIIQLLCMILPWPMRRFVLKFAFGYRLSSSARIGFSIIRADEVELADNSAIGHFNYVGELDRLELDKFAVIGNFNWITGLSTRLKSSFFSAAKNRRSELIVGECGLIAHQHFIDCTDRIVIGAYSGLAGARSHLITHGIEIITSRQSCAPIIIGDYTMIGAGSLILKGVRIPEKCVVGAGSVVNRVKADSHSLIAGNPATVIRKLPETAKFFSRTGSVIF